jgi:hypothetical protein
LSTWGDVIALEKVLVENGVTWESFRKADLKAKLEASYAYGNGDFKYYSTIEEALVSRIVSTDMEYLERSYAKKLNKKAKFKAEMIEQEGINYYRVESNEECDWDQIKAVKLKKVFCIEDWFEPRDLEWGNLTIAWEYDDIYRVIVKDSDDSEAALVEEFDFENESLSCLNSRIMEQINEYNQNIESYKFLRECYIVEDDFESAFEEKAEAEGRDED